MRLIFTCALALLPILATSIPQPARHGTRIPLRKRSTLTSPEGWADIDGLKRHLTYSESKIQRGLAAMKRNGAVQHVYVETVQTNATAFPASAAMHSGSEPLTDDSDDLWQGNILVGNPPKSFSVDFDTGSSDLFLPGSSCGVTCAGHTLYHPPSSQDLGKTFSLAYGDGSTVSGEQYTDTVTIAGLTAKHQTLGAAKRYSSGFSRHNFPPDGLLGMGFRSISDYNANPVFQTLVSQGVVTNPIFAFKFASSGSELYLGGVNSALFNPPFIYAPVVREGYWQVDIGSVQVGNTRVLSRTRAIIDTGTTLIIGDTTNVAKVYRQIPGWKDATHTVGAGFYTVPCASIPTLRLSLTFGSKMFPISPSTFNFGGVYPGSPDCIGGLVAGNVAGIGWIVGDVFLRNVYTVFDYGQSRVGFATLK